MRVIVAGGGIGGLATALSLHAAGITDVVVREAVRELRPLGVGINLLPHAVRELTELGLDDRLARLGVRTAELAYFNAFGQEIWAEPRGLDAGYRWPQYSVHRGELQMMLLEAVRERLGPDAVRTGEPVTGTDHDADLLIGADGIRSSVRAALYPDEGPPPWNGLVLWRGTTRARPFRTGRSMIMAGDDERRFVAYPITGTDGRGEALINWIAERPARPAERERLGPGSGVRGDWNREVEISTFLPDFEEWRWDWLDVPELVKGAPAVYEYPMVDRDPLPQWTFDRVTLLGDAAHALYPLGSNGASQAIIDARVLAHMLAAGGGVESYEELRRPATAAIANANRKMGAEVMMKLAHERAPRGFDDIERVIPRAEREEIAAGYKRTAGFDAAELNERASWSVGGQA